MRYDLPMGPLALAFSTIIFFSQEAHATPTLVPVADIADEGLHAWVKEGELLVGVPDDDERPGIRPLVGLAPLVLPEDLSDWTPVGIRCKTIKMHAARIGERSIVAEVTGPDSHPSVRLVSEGKVLAEAPLGHPAQVCEVLVAQADIVPGLEVLVAWRMEQHQPPLQGLTVYRIPELAL
ncbi:MAG: hypothetical protein QGG40_07185 [Myxococcota bacterium]|nr:hypothetical protein [Myxococcota bacterium]